ncbi:MAG: hypothetical protein BWY59_01433 [Verrucomicrobia bacterium ADurb.Bin345]|nr:MAG: hypothetical protein BWY59_01433 [Verrucomicrobia bacterium ADurb.Bin345]
MQHDAADDLHIERHHVPPQLVTADIRLRPDQPAAGVLHDGKRLAHDVVERLAFLNARAEFQGLGLEPVVGQRLELNLQRVDPLDQRAHFPDIPLVLRPYDLLQQPLHALFLNKEACRVGPPKRFGKKRERRRRDGFRLRPASADKARCGGNINLESRIPHPVSGDQPISPVAARGNAVCCFAGQGLAPQPT